MKPLILCSLLLLYACEKAPSGTATTDTKEDLCYESKEGINYDRPKQMPLGYTKQQAFPAHITASTSPSFRAFSYSEQKRQLEKQQLEESTGRASYKQKYGPLETALPGFTFLSTQNGLTLAQNRYGLWIVRSETSGPKPYFLGLTPSYYVDNLYKRDEPFLREDRIVLDGALVTMERLSRVPMRPRYKVLKESQELSIPLSTLFKDSDGDGYNDLFEEFLGLHPLRKDSDGDGLNDSEDPNPRYKPSSGDLTGLYLEILKEQTPLRSAYEFIEILTDCPDFLAVHPDHQRLLLYKTEDQAALKMDVIDSYFPIKYSRIQTYKDYPGVLFMDFSDQVGTGTLSGEKTPRGWQTTKKYTLTFGL